jgi:2-desacetyl-2-hydroxyethyl bacteriochlorophyllide A dehydrogenase
MKAAIYTGLQQIGIQEVERAAPLPGYVMLDTKQTGICGSDLHSYFGHWGQSPTSAPGHETCGIIVELGEGVTEFQLGDKVTIECFSHCGRCLYCRKGYYNHCSNRGGVYNPHGGFAEYTTAHTSGVFKIPDSMSFEEGALVEPLAVSYRAVVQGGATPRDRVAVIGGGTIGQYCLAAAEAIGVRETLITVKYDQQAQLAKDLGADHVVNINDTNVTEYVKDITNGYGMDVVIETVGGGGNFNAAMGMVRRRGAVVLVAGYYEPLEVDLSRIVWSEATVTGSNCYGYSGMETDFDAAIDLIATGKVDATKLVTHRFPLTEITEAFQVAADKKSGSIKVHVCQ